MERPLLPFDLPELADRAGVSIRTVRYYIQQGLLEKPEARGPGAHYTDQHLDRLLLIKKLQKEHLPLSEIRKAIESGVQPATPTQSARDYIRTVLGHDTEPQQESFTLRETPIPYGKPTTSRSQWERITLAPDIELHIRRPLTRTVNRQLEKLIDAARDIFEDEP